MPRSFAPAAVLLLDILAVAVLASPRAAAGAGDGDGDDRRDDPAYVAFARKRAAEVEASNAREGKLAAADVRLAPSTPAEVRPGAGRAFEGFERWAAPEEAKRWRALRAKLAGVEVQYIVSHHPWEDHPTAGIGVTFELAGAPRLLAAGTDGARALDLSGYGFEGEEGARDLLALGGRLVDLAAAEPGSAVEGADGRIAVPPAKTGRGRLPAGTVYDLEVQLHWRRPAPDGIGVDATYAYLRRSQIGDRRFGDPGGQEHFKLSFSPESNLDVTLEGAEGGKRARFRPPGPGVKGAAELAAYLGEGGGEAARPAPGPAKPLEALDDRRGLPLAWGASRAEVVALLGAAKSEERDAAGGADVLFWRGIAVVIREGRLAEVEVAFDGAGGPRRSGRHKKFRGKTAGGIGAGSRPEDLAKVYGAKGETGGARHGVIAARWTLPEATVGAVFEEDEGLQYLVFTPPGR